MPDKICFKRHGITVTVETAEERRIRAEKRSNSWLEKMRALGHTLRFTPQVGSDNVWCLNCEQALGHVEFEEGNHGHRDSLQTYEAGKARCNLG